MTHFLFPFRLFIVNIKIAAILIFLNLQQKTVTNLTCDNPKYIETVSEIYKNLPSAATAKANPSND